MDVKLKFRLSVFIQEHKELDPDIIWVGELPYIHKRKFLWIPFRIEIRHKKVKLAGWRLKGIEGCTWILENGGIAVQVGYADSGTTAPTDFMVGAKQNVQYVSTDEPIEPYYLYNLLKALESSS